MDLKRLFLGLIPLVAACKSLEPTRVVDADPVWIQTFQRASDTAVAYLLPHPDLNNNHYKDLILLARKQKTTLFVVRWKRYEEPVDFYQNVFPQLAQGQIIDSTSAITSQKKVRWIVAQADWITTGAQMAQGLKPQWFIPVDGYWQPLDIEWTLVAHQTKRPAWLNSAIAIEEVSHRVDRIQRNPTRDSLWMNRSYHYWNALLAQGTMRLPTTCRSIWITSQTHPWLSDASVRTLGAIVPNQYIDLPHDQAVFYQALARWIQEKEAIKD
jgi:hypothetical protein